MNDHYDVIVIGSGISSLTSAIILAQEGKKVCVLEQGARAGGYIGTFNKFNHHFYNGAHYTGALGKSEPFRVLLDYLGIYNKDIFYDLNSNGFDEFIFPDFKLAFAKGYEQTIQNILEIFPKEKAAIRKYFSIIQDTVNYVPTYRFNEKHDTDKLIKFLETPLQDVVDNITNEPKLKAVFYAYCSLHGVLPKDVSIGFHALVTDSIINSPCGMNISKAGVDLIGSFTRRIKELGGDIFFNERVTGIYVKNDKATHIETSTGKSFSAENIISGIHPKLTFDMVNNFNFRPSFTKRVSGIEESLAYFTLYTVNSNDKYHTLGKNYYYFNTYDFNKIIAAQDNIDNFSLMNFVSIKNSGEPTTFPFMIFVPDNINHYSEWRKSAYGKRPQEYRERMQNKASNLLNHIEKYKPGFKSSVKNYITASPLTNIHFNNSVEGSTFGIYHSIKQTGVRAIGPRTHIGNLFLTGQNTLFPGVLGSAISGLHSAGYIIGMKNMLKELRHRMSGE